MFSFYCVLKVETRGLKKALLGPNLAATVFILTETAYISISLVHIFPLLSSHVPSWLAQRESKLECLLCMLKNPSVPAKNHVLTSPLAFPLPQMNNNNSIIGFNLFLLYFWHAVMHAHQPSTLPKKPKKNPESQPQLGSLRAE